MGGKGLLIVYTGNGKGKTTAALGLAFRALGHRLPVCIIQFIKGSRKYGELQSAARFEGLLDFHVAGKGFTKKSKNIEKDREAALNGWNRAKLRIAEGRHRIIILDELSYAVNYGMLDGAEVMETLRNRPAGLHILVTGRNIPADIIAMADLVTEMVEVKHPYKSGVKGQKGIEW